MLHSYPHYYNMDLAERKQMLMAGVAFMGLAIVTFFVVEKGAAVLWFQSIHSPSLDRFFAIATKFGEESTLIPALLFLLWEQPTPWRQRLILLAKILLCLLGMFAVVVILKQYVFNFDRPLIFFEKQGVNLLPVEGVRLNRYHSFPSGHTATAFFAWYLVFNLLFAERWIHGWIVVAILVGVSRMYLGQHFMQDVWFGALIGYAWAYLALYWIRKSNKLY